MRPFRSKSFRVYYIAQMVAFVGNWAHEMARAFLALEIGGSTAALGSMLLFLAVPSLFLSLHGGVLADRIDSKKIIAFTRSTLAISSFTFFIVLSQVELKLWMLYAFTFFDACLMSYEHPSYMATLQRLVARKDFKMAVVLQSTNFHLSRALGPAVGGLIMYFFDVKYVFLYASVAYMYIAYTVKRTQMRAMPKANKKFESQRFKGLKEIGDAVAYIFGTPGLRYKFLQFLLSMLIIVPVTSVVFRSFLKFKFDLTGDEFGYVFSFPAAGAMTGAIIFILVKYKDPIRNLRFAIPILGLLVAAMIRVPNTQVAVLLLALIGLFQYFAMNSTTQSLHFQIDESYRGRLGSMIAICFGALTPLMSFPLSLYADKYGFTKAILHPLVIYMAGSFVLAVLHGKIKMMRIPLRRRPREEIPETTSNPLQ